MFFSNYFGNELECFQMFKCQNFPTEESNLDRPLPLESQIVCGISLFLNFFELELFSVRGRREMLGLLPGGLT